MANSSLLQAKKQKKDEFYTQLSDIEKELKHYKGYFKDKVVYCNCDDPRASQFFHYFSYNFERLGLKKLITTCYKNQQMDLFSQGDAEQAICLEYTGDKNGNRVPDPEEIGIIHLEGDGDFRSRECVELLEQADIVVTNPPFSLFREYVAQLVEHGKKFIIIGNQNAITYKEIFKMIKNGKIWLGHNCNKTMRFKVPVGYVTDDEGFANVPAISWFTNLPTKKRTEDLILYKRYHGHEDEYPRYDNYDAIEVSRVKNIPMDYEGIMGVPITFLNKHNPEQFEIIDCWNAGTAGKRIGATITKAISNGKEIRWNGPTVNGQTKYFRILIKKKVEK